MFQRLIYLYFLNVKCQSIQDVSTNTIKSCISVSSRVTEVFTKAKQHLHLIWPLYGPHMWAMGTQHPSMITPYIVIKEKLFFSECHCARAHMHSGLVWKWVGARKGATTIVWQLLQVFCPLSVNLCPLAAQQNHSKSLAGNHVQCVSQAQLKKIKIK